ncbi:efflux RND transporter periplasmic adaptor subunit [Phenylobacterium sp.]|uniref:efflux RND transporter periplasmic adaptor subunit n=1 Tax=Phenylobacterium sp. TaxID=1871053 RepID=UPI00301CA261
MKRLKFDASAAGGFSRRRNQVLAGMAVVALAACAYVLRPGTQPAAAPAASASAPVRVTQVLKLPFDVELKALGAVTPLNTVSVRSRVDGELHSIHFEEGQTVARGQLLARVDPRAYRAALIAAEGERAQSQAQLRQAENELEIYRTLAEKGISPKVRSDQQQAIVDQHRGALRGHEGRIADARLSLDFTDIRAPIAGRIGMRGLDRGNIVRSGDGSVLATIVQTAPVSVVFTVPEVQLQDVREALSAGALSAEAWDRGEQKRLATGVVTMLDNQIDRASGTVKLRAHFANADEALFPNQFVNVRLKVRTLADALLIPDSAVQRGATGPYVYVVGADNLARRRELRLGPGDGERVSVLHGLTAGERVVLEGFDRVKDGGPVEIIGGSTAAAG